MADEKKGTGLRPGEKAPAEPPRTEQTADNDRLTGGPLNSEKVSSDQSRLGDALGKANDTVSSARRNR
jgi:hypothetical protein